MASMIFGRRPAVLVVPALVLAVLGGCGASSGGVSVEDPWAKAADGGMTGVFGILVNDSDREVTVLAASSPASARAELHTTVADDGEPVMRETESFVIPPRGTYELAPGGDHVMLMELAGPLRPGEEVTVVLRTDDGTEIEFEAQVRAFAGGNEEYVGGSHGD